MAGCAMARPEAARAEARPPAAVGFRGVPRPGTGADAEGDAATVAERGTPGVDALTGVLAFDVRRHGLRFAFALPTERMDAASESPGTCSVENVGAVELIRMSAIVGMSCSCSLNPVGESTRRGLSLGTSYSLDWGDLGRVGHWHAIHEWSNPGVGLLNHLRSLLQLLLCQLILRLLILHLLLLRLCLLGARAAKGTTGRSRGGTNGVETEGVDLGDGEAVERLRVRGAQREDCVGPVLAGVLVDVGTVVEGDVR